MTGYQSKKKAARDKLIELAKEGMGMHSPDAPEYIVCEALIEALAQPSDSVEKPIDFELAYGEIYKDQRAALAKSLAQPAQEPVANDRALQLVTHQLNHWVAYATELRERLNKYEGGAPMLLNITPPQRTWVDLTYDERYDCVHSGAGQARANSARAARYS